MGVIRDLVSRITFRTDTTELKTLDNRLLLVKRGIAAIASTALAGWAVRAGGDIAGLELQLKTLSQAGLKPIQEVIDELSANTGPGVGLASIFSREDLLQASIALEQLGFRGVETGEMLQRAATLSARANRPIQEIAQGLGAAIADGGLPDFLRRLGFVSREVAEDIGIMENKLGEAAGVLAPRAMRRLREALAGDFFANLRPRLEGELRELQEGPAGVTRRVGAQLENLWNEIARNLLELLKGPLNDVANITRQITGLFRGWREELEKNGSAVETFFARMDKGFPDLKQRVENMKDILGEDLTGLLVGGTVGGLLAFLVTGNPIFLAAGAVAGAVIGKKVQRTGRDDLSTEEGRELARKRRFPTREELREENRLRQEAEEAFSPRDPPPRPALPFPEGGAQNNRGTGGDVNVSVSLVINTQASDADAVGSVVEDMLTSTMRKVAQDLLPLTEGVV